jgi:molybdopterin-guanine dinucleotide biosynthesis protein A
MVFQNKNDILKYPKTSPKKGALKMHGIILAGGKSTRMQANKSFEKIKGRTLIEIIVNILKPIFNDKIIIITNETELYGHLNVRLHRDLLQGKGPLGGIYTGLMVSPSFYNFFLPCDMPFVNGEAIEYMIQEKEGYDVIVPVIRGYIEPLYGIYSKNCTKPIETCLLKNRLQVKCFYPLVRVKTIPETAFKKMDPQLKMFVNINTRKELSLAQTL